MQIQTYNKISNNGLLILEKNGFTHSENAENPVGAMVRSASLHETEFPESLLAISRAGAGTNNIPIDSCSQKGIVVFNTPGANANAVKELVLAGLLLASRKVVAGIEWAATLKGRGEDVGPLVEKGKSAFVGPEIKGKTLGVIGLGAIGVLVANSANALLMKVSGYDPYLSVESAWNLTHSAHRATNMDEIFATSDYITIHVPLNGETKGFINKETIAKMKDGVRILNFSRAGLVNSEDMIEALNSGKVASYVTDFPTDELLGCNGVVSIPHLGASTPESEENCAQMAAEELCDYILNGNIAHSVNMPQINLGEKKGKRICVIHKNIPNMITQITSALSGINIENLLNKSRGEYAYSMIDVATCDDEKVKNTLEKIEGIIRVRII